MKHACACDPGWEHLNSFRVRAHPFDLTVLTDAPTSRFRSLTEEWQRRVERGENVNVEDVVRKHGYYAVTGKTTAIDLRY